MLRDLREWIALLEREGELVRVGVEVDPQLEVTEIKKHKLRAKDEITALRRSL